MCIIDDVASMRFSEVCCGWRMKPFPDRDVASVSQFSNEMTKRAGTTAEDQELGNWSYRNVNNSPAAVPTPAVAFIFG